MLPIECLRRRRSRLLKAYVLHVGLFTSSCAFAATDATYAAIATTLWLALVTIPPVLLYTVLVHKSCRAIDPSAPSAGLLQVILFTVFLTPYESSLVLPARNLWVSRRILRAADRPSTMHAGDRPIAARFRATRLGHQDSNDS